MVKHNRVIKGLEALTPIDPFIEAVRSRYLEVEPEIFRNTIYFGELAFPRRVYDPALGYVNLKRLEEFVEENKKD